MSDEGFSIDPLRSVLSEMRQELDDLIGQEITRLVAAETRLGGPQPRRGVPSRDAEGPEAAPAADASPGTAPSRPPSRVPLDGMGRADDTGSRLDALARRLEGRLNLKRPRDRADEGKAFVQDEPAAHPNIPGSGRA